jgi:hypothetical protein
VAEPGFPLTYTRPSVYNNYERMHTNIRLITE